MLASVFHECDLLITECIGARPPRRRRRAGARRAAVRVRPRAPQPGAAGAAVVPRRRGPAALAAHRRGRARISPPRSGRVGSGAHRPPDPGFFAAAHGWMAGHALSTVVGDEEVTGGDFVRTMKQLIDLARQVADVAPVAANACGRPRGRRAGLPGNRRRRHDRRCRHDDGQARARTGERGHRRRPARRRRCVPTTRPGRRRSRAANRRPAAGPRRRPPPFARVAGGPGRTRRLPIDVISGDRRRRRTAPPLPTSSSGVVARSAGGAAASSP